jgi:hypothetical protein
MNSPFIALLGSYDEITTERIVLKEIKVEARDRYEAHKLALFKCNLKEGQIVLQIHDYTSRRVLFDFVNGFGS